MSENRETRFPRVNGEPLHTEHIAGQLTADGGELRAPTFSQHRYYPLCCGEALVVYPQACVCAFVTTCPNHGTKHNGTHD